MFTFSKSREDLKKDKSDVQYKIICDWLRTIDNKLNHVKRTQNGIINLLNDSPLNDSYPEDMEIVSKDDSSAERPVLRQFGDLRPLPRRA